MSLKVLKIFQHEKNILKPQFILAKASVVTSKVTVEFDKFDKIANSNPENALQLHFSKIRLRS